MKAQTIISFIFTILFHLGANNLFANDYVENEIIVKFKKGYLTENYLNSKGEFLKANGHLPGMPSEMEVIKNGVSVGEMQKKMMQKIEELTLYVIELKKENERIKAQLNNNK